MDKVMFHRLRQRRGLATAIAILVLAIALAIAFGMCDMSTQLLRLSSSDTWGDRARLAAEGGASDAMAQLKANQAWSAGFTGKALPTDTATKYTVKVTNNGSGSAPVTATDGTVVPAGLVYLQSAGTSGPVTRFVDVLVQVAPGANPYTYGLFATGTGALDIFKATINSYDSSVAPITFGNSAVIGANGSIDINKQASVLGDAYYAGTFTPTTPPAGLDVHQLTAPLVWPNVTFSAPSPTAPVYSDGMLVEGSYSSLSLANNSTVTLKGGTYYLQTLALGQGSHLNVQAGQTATVYLSGTMTVLQNATINSSGRPQNMQFYSSSTSLSPPAVQFTNNGVVVATIYAPQAGMELRNNGEFFGSLVAKETALSNNSIIHYDTSLSNQTGPYGGSSTLTVYSWDLH